MCFQSVPVQLVAVVSKVLEDKLSDRNVDVVPQMHELGQTLFFFSWLLLTAHAKTENNKMTFKLAHRR